MLLPSFYKSFVCFSTFWFPFWCRSLFIYGWLVRRACLCLLSLLSERLPRSCFLIRMIPAWKWHIKLLLDIQSFLNLEIWSKLSFLKIQLWNCIPWICKGRTHMHLLPCNSWPTYWFRLWKPRRRLTWVFLALYFLLSPFRLFFWKICIYMESELLWSCLDHSYEFDSNHWASLALVYSFVPFSTPQLMLNLYWI